MNRKTDSSVNEDDILNEYFQDAERCQRQISNTKFKLFPRLFDSSPHYTVNVQKINGHWVLTSLKGLNASVSEQKEQYQLLQTRQSHFLKDILFQEQQENQQELYLQAQSNDQLSIGNIYDYLLDQIFGKRESKGLELEVELFIECFREVNQMDKNSLISEFLLLVVQLKVDKREAVRDMIDNKVQMLAHQGEIMSNISLLFMYLTHGDIQKATELALNVFMATGFYPAYSCKLPNLSGFTLLLALFDLLPQYQQLISEIIKNKLQIGKQLLDYIETFDITNSDNKERENNIWEQKQQEALIFINSIKNKKRLRIVELLVVQLEEIYQLSSSQSESTSCIMFNLKFSNDLCLHESYVWQYLLKESVEQVGQLRIQQLNKKALLLQQIQYFLYDQSSHSLLYALLALHKKNAQAFLVSSRMRDLQLDSTAVLKQAQSLIKLGQQQSAIEFLQRFLNQSDHTIIDHPYGLFISAYYLGYLLNQPLCYQLAIYDLLRDLSYNHVNLLKFYFVSKMIKRGLVFQKNAKKSRDMMNYIREFKCSYLYEFIVQMFVEKKIKKHIQKHKGNLLSEDTFQLQDIQYIDKRQLKQQVLTSLKQYQQSSHPSYPIMKVLSDKILYKHTTGKVKEMCRDNMKYLSEQNAQRLQQMQECLNNTEDWVQDIVFHRDNYQPQMENYQEYQLIKYLLQNINEQQSIPKASEVFLFRPDMLIIEENEVSFKFNDQIGHLIPSDTSSIYNNPFGLKTLGAIPGHLIMEPHYSSIIDTLQENPQERLKVLFQLVFISQAFSLLQLHGLAIQPLSAFSLDLSLDLKIVNIASLTQFHSHQYFSMEMFNCSFRYDTYNEDKQEVWALGLKIHHIYYGQNYYQTEGLPEGLSEEDMMTNLFQHQKDKLEQSIEEGEDGFIKGLIRDCLRYDSDDRPSLEDIRSSLEKYLGSENTMEYVQCYQNSHSLDGQLRVSTNQSQSASEQKSQWSELMDANGWGMLSPEKDRPQVNNYQVHFLGNNIYQINIKENLAAIMTSHGHMVIMPQPELSQNATIYFDNYDFIQGQIDTRCKFIDQGIYNSYVKNDQLSLDFDQFPTMDINLVNTEVLFQICQEQDNEMKLKSQKKFQNDLQIFIQTYLGNLENKVPELTYIDINSNIYSQFQFEEQVLTVIQNNQSQMIIMADEFYILQFQLKNVQLKIQERIKGVQILEQLCDIDKQINFGIFDFKFEIERQNYKTTKGEIIFDGQNRIEFNEQFIKDELFECRIEYQSQQYYQGQVINGKYNGIGEYGNEIGVVFKGVFEDDILQTGLVNYRNFPQIVQGGKYLEYTGNVKFDPVIKQYLRHSEKGQLFFQNGDVYQGSFEQNMRHGQGTLLYANGDMFVGNFIKDMKHGYGQLTGKNMEFKGEYEEDLKNGSGRERIKVKGQWITYEGEYINDYKEGSGKLDYQGQGFYQGSFQEGCKHGTGVWNDSAKGVVYQVKFDKDRLVRMDKASQHHQYLNAKFRTFTLV